jgi:type IV secretory pathway TrbD component
LYPNEYYDPYKYSPAFALAFGVLSYLPDTAGLLIWNLLNAFVLFVAIYKLPNIATKYKSLMLLTASIELMTCMQSCQSNALIVGLLILGFCMLEKENYLLATLFISLTVFIKLFGIVICLLFIFYPKKAKIALYMIGWFAFLAIIPIVATGYEQLMFLYKSWLTPLSNDHNNSNGYSVIGWLHTWFKLNINKTLVLAVGAILLMLPLLKLSRYKDYTFRLIMLSSILVWMVIFNHMAESPTFIIAIAGVAIWFYSQKPTTLNIALLVLAVVFTCLSPTDIFPPFIRKEIFQPYVVKAVPCILIWLKISCDLLFDKINPNLIEE